MPFDTAARWESKLQSASNFTFFALEITSQGTTMCHFAHLSNEAMHPGTMLLGC